MEIQARKRGQSGRKLRHARHPSAAWPPLTLTHTCLILKDLLEHHMTQLYPTHAQYSSGSL
eukprot:scaffold1638_cov258-Pinguiococcus_pyrenoidosus.AAC.25